MPTMLPVLTDTAPICCEPIGSAAALSRDEAEQLALRLKALADPTRLQLLTALLTAPDGTACTCDLAPAVDLTEGTVSHHLKRLESAGLVSKERRGLNVHYRAESEAIHAIARALNAGCC
ncbi:ArsR/SmtB family transcription factor [Microcella sp.]|uniref:ArsR/SmtB family transcription factor n=1 Tax=Microcella sp. TaxID=1913979 RepID=UPI002565666E|nr:metalloregulator ArsR/SmtB family transcription factor [Microcella sp.]MBX9472582.1 metalloregulator ArsR/SmtB family transcription factor [Microcella sp.]